jgi:hypothetical protein
LVTGEEKRISYIEFYKVRLRLKMPKIVDHKIITSDEV